jgi:hypothetical protein
MNSRGPVIFSSLFTASRKLLHSSAENRLLHIDAWPNTCPSPSDSLAGIIHKIGG